MLLLGCPPSFPDTAFYCGSRQQNPETRRNPEDIWRGPHGGCKFLVEASGSFLILLQRPEGKNDKEKERRKREHGGEKREEQRGRKGARGWGGRGRETAVSFWEEKPKVTVMSQGAAASGLLKTCSLDSAPNQLAAWHPSPTLPPHSPPRHWGW